MSLAGSLGVLSMSEFEDSSPLPKDAGLWIGVTAVVVFGVCVLMCAGLAAVGLMVPVVMRHRAVGGGAAGCE